MVFDRGTGTEKAPGRRSKVEGTGGRARHGARAAGLVAACCVAVTSNFLFFGGFGTYNAFGMRGCDVHAKNQNFESGAHPPKRNGIRFFTHTSHLIAMMPTSPLFSKC